MAKLISNFLLSLLAGLGLAFGFTSLCLGLSIRPPVDQALLLFFSTAAFGYLIFSVLESRHRILDSLSWKGVVLDRGKIGAFLRQNAAGMLLAVVFFGIYTFIALK